MDKTYEGFRKLDGIPVFQSGKNSGKSVVELDTGFLWWAAGMEWDPHSFMGCWRFLSALELAKRGELIVEENKELKTFTMMRVGTLPQIIPENWAVILKDTANGYYIPETSRGEPQTRPVNDVAVDLFRYEGGKVTALPHALQDLGRLLPVDISILRAEDPGTSPEVSLVSEAVHQAQLEANGSHQLRYLGLTWSFSVREEGGFTGGSRRVILVEGVQL